MKSRKRTKEILKQFFENFKLLQNNMCIFEAFFVQSHFDTENWSNKRNEVTEDSRVRACLFSCFYFLLD